MILNVPAYLLLPPTCESRMSVIHVERNPYTGRRIVRQHLVQRGIDIAVAASLAQLRRTRGEAVGGSVHGAGRFAKGDRDIVRVEFARTGKTAVQAAGDRIVRSQQAANLLLREGLPILHDENLPGSGGQFADQAFRKRILRHFQDGNFIWKGLPYIVIGNAAGDDAEGRALLFQ